VYRSKPLPLAWPLVIVVVRNTSVASPGCLCAPAEMVSASSTSGEDTAGVVGVAECDAVGPPASGRGDAAGGWDVEVAISVTATAAAAIPRPAVPPMASIRRRERRGLAGAGPSS